ncbi:MAG TPA: hypothetical protein VN982_07565 [Candidatus Dormibacteraeota bacterium]|nr:hypothetical protein [Candidatus Dormibacteraeota bacterium]
MSWSEHHAVSERYAIDAEATRRDGDAERAEELYKKAAHSEALALDSLTDDKARTRGITAVSVVALWYKGREYAVAERSAHQYLAAGKIPPFAESQLRDLLSSIWTARAAQKAGIKFVPGDVLVSVKGGEVIHGGAPLELIVRKVEGIQSVLYRTVEWMLARPFRRRGGPPSDIQTMFRPWLFQAPAGSYQFAVRMQEPAQRALWEEARPQIGAVTTTFFKVLRASASNPDEELNVVVPDREYRSAFANLARNLSPSGETFNRLEVRDASSPAEPIVTFAAETRTELNAVIRKLRPSLSEANSDQQVTLRGVLRGVHLDKDWLDVATDEAGFDPHITVLEISEVLDDVIGPMVNKRVVVTAVRRANKYFYRDIELQE